MKNFLAIHPSLVGVGELPVAEDVDEEEPVRLQQPRQALHQRLVVPHVLEHLDRDDAVEAAVEHELAHVGGDDLDIGGRARLDPLALQARVRDRRDPRFREPLGGEERERPPAAAEVEDRLAVLDPGALAREGEHRLLGLGERLDSSGPVAGAVLEPGPRTSSKNSGGTS